MKKTEIKYVYTKRIKILLFIVYIKNWIFEIFFWTVVIFFIYFSDSETFLEIFSKVESNSDFTIVLI